MLRFALVAATAAAVLPGCAALKPIRGIPVEEYAADAGIPSRGNKSTIDLSLLVQTKPDEYRVGPEDVLAVYIPGVLGTRIERDDQVGNAPPINQPQLEEDVPTVGFPLTVRSDGTLPLPEVGPIRVEGMTLGGVEQAILKKYTEDAKVLRKDKAQVIVSLVREREYEVLVVRQEAAPTIATAQSNLVNVGSDRKGAARMVKLRAYRNDVLHALAAEQDTDGLPGLDAENTIYVIRRRKSAAGWPDCGLNPGETIIEGPGYGEVYGGHGGAVYEDGGRGRRRLLGRLRGDRGAGSGGCGDVSCDGCDSCVEMTYADPYADLTTPQPQYATPRPAAPPSYHPQPAAPYTAAPYTAAPYTTAPSFDEMFLPSQPVAPAPRPAEPAERLAPEPVEESDRDREDAARYMPWVQPRMLRSPTYAYPPREQTAGRPATIEQLGHSEAVRRPPSEARLDMRPATSAVRGQSGGRKPSVFGSLNPFARKGPRPEVLRASAVDPSEHALNLAAHVAEVPPPVPPQADIPETWQEMLANFDPTIENPHVIKIPVRLAPGERPCFSEKDIILEDGDIVFVESRGTEVFYTGGLLGGGQYELPRDYDLRLIEAMSIAQGPQNVQQGRSAGGNTALNGDVTESGSRVVVLRTLPGGAKIPIEVDFYKAVTHPEEHNILIQPGDVIIVQYTAAEAVYAFVQKNFLESALFGFATGFITADE